METALTILVFALLITDVVTTAVYALPIIQLASYHITTLTTTLPP
jgi:hypothetical protein